MRNLARFCRGRHRSYNMKSCSNLSMPESLIKPWGRNSWILASIVTLRARMHTPNSEIMSKELRGLVAFCVMRHLMSMYRMPSLSLPMAYWVEELVGREEIEEVDEVSTEIGNQGARPTHCSRPRKFPVDRPVRPVEKPGRPVCTTCTRLARSTARHGRPPGRPTDIALLSV